jgi:tRNA-dihydrouridine synthase
MVEHTGVDGVVIGRGCLGRPWLFADLQAAFTGSPALGSPALPSLGEVAAIMSRHAHLLVDALGDERHGCADFRKHVAWYLKGFPVGGDLRRSLAMVSSLAELDDLLARLDPQIPGKVSLPYGWLDSRDDDTVPEGAEMENSGG